MIEISNRRFEFAHGHRCLQVCMRISRSMGSPEIAERMLALPFKRYARRPL